MNNYGITEYFESVETVEEYNGYFCRIPEIITIMILGSMCGLKTLARYTNGKQITDLRIGIDTCTVQYNE